MTDLSTIPDSQLDAMIAAQTPAISSAILGQESGNNANAHTSIDGAIGQAQITPGTFKQYALPGEDINNPADNLAVHNRIISDLSDKANGDPARIAVGYFSGPGNIAPSDSPTPYKNDTKDGNGKSVSSYVSDVMGRMPVQTADSGNVKTDAQVDAPQNPLASMSDEELDKAIAAASPKAPENDYSIKGDLKQMGQSISSGVKDIGDLFKKDTWTGANIAEGSPASQKLQSDVIQGNYMGIPLDVIKRMNEAMAGNPAGKILGAVGGIAGAPLAPAFNAATDALAKAGVDPAVTQFAANISPMFMKGMDTDRGAPAVDDPLAQKMIDMGVPLKQSQVNGGGFSKLADSAVKDIPGSGASKFNDAQFSGFNRAISHTFGEDSDKITPDVIDSAYTRIGNMYDTALKGKQIPFTNSDLQAFSDIDDKTSFLDPAHRSIVTNQLDKIMNEAQANGGTIPGETLGAIRSTIAGGIKSAPPGAGMLLRELRDHIINMSGTAAPQLREANAQYSALKTIEPLAIKATASGGNISPSLLQNQVVKTIGPKQYASGGAGNLGNLADLARGGQKYLKNMVPDSGTAKRSLFYASGLELLGSGVDSIVTGNPTPFLSSVATLGGGAIAARLLNKKNTNPTAVENLLQGRPNSYSAVRLHPANIAGIAVNKERDRQVQQGK